MKNTIGTNLTVTIFGESHGDAIGAVIDGITPGLCVNEDNIRRRLVKRMGDPEISTKRREPDNFKIVSGVFEGKTTGTPLAIIIPNESVRSRDYSELASVARPGHADYTAQLKYHGFQDYRGGGHFSGRITAAIVAAGSILLDALNAKGIYIGTHILECGGVSDRKFESFPEDVISSEEMEFSVLDKAAAESIRAAVKNAAAQLDSVGGIAETAVCNAPAGVGEPWFGSVESVLSQAMFSIPAVKGIEFGAGFAFAKMTGSQANDAFYMDNGSVRTKTNNNAGINGGITNGEPIIFRTAVKPTPSIFKAQQTVNFKTEKDTVLELKGRHDPAIIGRFPVVADCVTAIAVADMLVGRFGTDYLSAL